MRPDTRAVATALCLLLGLASPSWSGPAASPHLSHAFRIFLLLEERIEHLEWEVAGGIAAAVRAETLRLRNEMLEAAGAQRVDDYFRELGLLIKSVDSRDRERSMECYAEAERHLFAVIDAFEHPSHPIFAILDADVDETLRAVLEGDVSHADHEIAEVAVYFRTAARVLEQQDAPAEEIESFEKTLERARDAVAARDGAAAEAALRDLSKLSSRFLTR